MLVLFHNQTNLDPAGYAAGSNDQRMERLMAHNHNHSHNNHGFTLIELVVVIAILGILAVTIAAIWPKLPIKTAAQAELLANDIRYTQNLAMAKSERHALVITSTKSYQITNSTGAVITMPSGNSMTIFGTGIAFGTITNLPNNIIVFDSRGTPYIDNTSPGTALNAAAVISLTSNDGASTITISPKTGWIATS